MWNLKCNILHVTFNLLKYNKTSFGVIGACMSINYGVLLLLFINLKLSKTYGRIQTNLLKEV